MESLPQEAQDRYSNPEAEEGLLSNKYSMTQLQETDYKAKVVQDFKASGLSAEKFLEQFNAENDEKIAVKTLYIWQEKFTESSTQAFVYGRGGHNKGACSISDEVWEFFYSLYMTLQKRSIQWCYDKTRMKFPDIPSVSAFKRKVRTIPDYTNSHSGVIFVTADVCTIIGNRYSHRDSRGNGKECVRHKKSYHENPYRQSNRHKPPYHH